VTNKGFSSRPNILTPFSPINKNNEDKIDEVRKKRAFFGSYSSEEHNALSVHEGERLELPHMPPPNHEPSSPIQNPGIEISSNQETRQTIAMNPETSSMAHLALEFGSRSASQVRFTFETPTRFLDTQGEVSTYPGATSYTTFTDSSFMTSISSTTTTPEKEAPGATERIPLEEKEAKSMNATLSSTSRTSSAHELGLRSEKELELKAPITPRKSSIPNGITKPSVFLSRFIDQGSKDPMANMPQVLQYSPRNGLNNGHLNIQHQ
jgi:hypothetical protein